MEIFESFLVESNNSKETLVNLLRNFKKSENKVRVVQNGYVL